MTELLKTPLDRLHDAWGGKMAEFAGYRLPLSYAGGGFIGEHLWTREHASLFDVSHMGQTQIGGAEAGAALSRLSPGDVAAIAEGDSKYAVSFQRKRRRAGRFYCRQRRRARMVCGFQRLPQARRHRPCAKTSAAFLLPHRTRRTGRSSPCKARKPKKRRSASPPTLRGCGLCRQCGLILRARHAGFRAAATRGRTVLSFLCRPPSARSLRGDWRRHDEVKPAGLGARDSLRLEAGLCLYGNELGEDISIVDAGLIWTIPKARRTGGDYLGADSIAKRIADGAEKKLIGLAADGRKVARAGAELFSDAEGGEAMWRGYQRGVFADFAAADCNGLCARRVCGGGRDGVRAGARRKNRATNGKAAVCRASIQERKLSNEQAIHRRP